MWWFLASFLFQRWSHATRIGNLPPNLLSYTSPQIPHRLSLPHSFGSIHGIDMAELKTQKSDASVSDFIAKLRNPPLEADCQTLSLMMEQLTGAPAKMWGSSIVGFGSYRYTYSTGRTGDWMEVGFSPRKQNLTIYMMCGFDSFDPLHTKLLQQLGPHSTGSSCLYVKRLSDLDLTVLKKLLTHSIGILRQKFPATTSSDTAVPATKSKKSTTKSVVAVTKKASVKKASVKKTSAKKSSAKKASTNSRGKKSVKKSKRT